MMKSLFAMLFLCTLTIATAATRPAPVSAAPAAPQFGSCRWYCGSTSFLTQSACQQACPIECDEIC